MVADAISGVNIWSLASSKLNVRFGARSDSSVIVTGIIFGPGPSRPAMATARSCRNDPITSPVVESFIDEKRLGSTVCT